MKNEKRRLSFIGKIDKIEKRMKAGLPSCISVSDSDGNKVIPAGEDPYPFLPDNVFAVHSPLFYEVFTLDINKEGVSPADFIKVYGEGFKDGLKFLERERIDIDQLDDENKRESIIKRLKRILYDRKDKSGRTIIDKGRRLQVIWTDKSIFESGEYSGAMTAIDQFGKRAGLDEKDLKNEPQPKTEKKKENPYPEIFPDVFSYNLFERLHDDYKDSNNKLADYGFVYRKMWDLGHILKYQKPEMFRCWISKEPYEIIVGNKFKTLDRCTTANKENNFKLAFDLVEKLC
jgi:hypothetical protein